MKKTLTISAFLLVALAIACEKNKTNPPQQNAKTEAGSENYGPYGKLSQWKSIGGDTLFSDTLTLSFFFEEKNSPCNICYYQQNYPLWNDYEYTLSASKCDLPKDSLVITDVNTNKKAIFILIK